RWTARLERSEPLVERGEWERVEWHRVVESGDRYLTNASGVRVVDGETERASYATYADGEIQYRRIDDEDDPVRYERTSLVDRRDGAVRPESVYVIDRYLDGKNVSVIRLEIPGETVYRVTVTDAPDTVGELGTVSDYRATAYVTDAGFVARLDVEYTARFDGATSEVRYGFDFDDVGNATVDEPAWIELARQRTATEGDARGNDDSRRADPS
ncbi:hypothetical protein ACFQE1_20560, partial [Halobium palmae]